MNCLRWRIRLKWPGARRGLVVAVAAGNPATRSGARRRSVGAGHRRHGGRSSADTRQTALAGPQAEPLRRGGDQRGGRRVRRRRRQLVGCHRDPHPQPDRVSVHRRRGHADRQAAAAMVPVPPQGDRGNLAGGADAATRGGQTAARRWCARHPNTRGGVPPRLARHPRTVTGHDRRSGARRPCGPAVFRGDRAGAQRRDPSRRG
jgi:hypothetical protein